MGKSIHKNTGAKYALLHLYLYSSIHIALCAMAITMYSYLMVPSLIIDFTYVAFVGSSTLLLYCLHRIIGIQKPASYSHQGRFAIIIKYKSHLIVYAILSASYCIYVYYNFEWSRKLHLILPAILSLSYSLPIFFGGKRLRDFNWIKIFLIAICWAVITCTIPLYEVGLDYKTTSILTIERALFIFAITIPFDIRDRQIDEITGVNTLATSYNDQELIKLSWFALTLAAMVSIACYLLGITTEIILFSSLTTYSVSAILISKIDKYKSDYYYSLWIDGTLAIPIILWAIALICTK